MKLSTKVRYGTRAMLEMALAYPGESVSVKDMAERQRLSVKYLEQIMALNEQEDAKRAGSAESPETPREDAP